MSIFFVNRPVFAWVIALSVMLAGLLGLYSLSVSQYPDVAPPTIQISATYPGASAETVENSVTKIIEQNMTGIDGLVYISSTSSASGSSQISLTFESGVDPDTAQVQTQNKLQLVEAQLPQPVQDQGVQVTKSSGGILMVGSLVSNDPSLTSIDLANLISTRLEDTLRRVDGVGNLQIFGSGYAMRVWLDPSKLARYQLTPSDVTAAIRAQNTQVSVGQLGALPAVDGQQQNFTITSQSQLESPEAFEAIVLKTATDGSVVTLNDVARVEIGAESYATAGRYNGRPAAGFGVNLAAGANAIETADGVRAALDTLSSTLPSSVDIVYPYDTTPFVELSIEKVVETLLEAIVLVFVVMLVFLQTWRATIIPMIVVPIVLLGTFAVLAVAGFSINTLTMFAMVLAIGLLVDDAIVVVENVERVMEEEKLSPREATIKSMSEITGALIGIALVLSAVFLPMAFFSGSVGIIYKQFSITIVTAMFLSVVFAVILVPVLCATLLKPSSRESRFILFRWFNKGFDKTNRGYTKTVGGIVRRPFRVMILFLMLSAAAGYTYLKLPSSFLPQEDQGVLFTLIQLPAGATAERTLSVVERVEGYFLEQEEEAVQSVFAVIGFSFSGSGQNNAIVFVKLKDFEEREDPAVNAQAVVGRAMGNFFQIRDAQVFALTPPAIQGLGTSGGFELYLKDTGNQGHEALMAAQGQLLGAANQNPLLTGVRPNGETDQPQFHIDIDQKLAGALNLDLGSVNQNLSTAWAGSYVNDFNNNGDIQPVYVQADAPFRMQPSDIDRWYARNSNGEMVPFSAFSRSSWSQGPPRLARYNGVSAVNIQGSAAPGVSSGDAMDQMEQIVAGLGNGFTSEWTGLSYQERLSGSQATALYALSVLVVFLCLAALYESWAIPFAVILTVPVGILGAVLAATYGGQANDIYFKVGLLTTIGLASKNAILIVEFARELQAQGKELLEATIEASYMRLRPILMTSFAFMLGVLPLAIATGAGSGAQNAIGIGVLGGMLSATVLGVFFIPLLFVVVYRIFVRSRSKDSADDAPSAEQSAAPAE
ncbi:efflux RND transporter permease subunit [Jiella marina]|uniref:efflux RND transporter permease subunit n=1 Tax=Jiella sp. LLJ827 TaxID=2917712 RepID=UPI0021016456|nr:efflux RND transporter permease subunit [Jiella sp. LLJ827]MCQ0986829.1 efflux RND transporter permease subunit [Jiella sp. LLJ827]